MTRDSELIEMMSRGKSIPGGACGFWGACGAGISSGMFISIISKSTPLAIEPFALSHQMTAKSLGQIGQIESFFKLNIRARERPQNKIFYIFLCQES